MKKVKQVGCVRSAKGSSKFFQVFGVILGATIFAGLMFTVNNTWATTSVIDTVSANLESACSMNWANVGHTLSLQNGNVVNTDSDANHFTINVTCNDAGGYGIFAIGYSSDTEGTTSMISSAGSTYNIATGTATSGSTSNWAMKVTPGTGITSANSFNAYHAVPANYTRVAEKTSGVDLGTTTAITSDYQVFSSTTQAAGTYTGKVRYALVHPSTEECPEGYEMEGGVCVKSYIMQNVATWGSTLTTGEAVQAKDSRDNKLYYVTKLADGNIWMTQNLDLDLNTDTLPLTSSTSDVSTDWNPGSTYYTQSTTSSSGTDTDMYSWNLGDYAYDGTTNSSCGRTATSYADCTSYGFSATSSPTVAANHYHVGNLYQWNAATAGSGGTITSGEAADSICPSGWRLPTGNTSGEFEELVSLYDSTYDPDESTGTVQTLLNAPLYFIRGGDVAGGNLWYAGGTGYYWSSTPRSTSTYSAHFLNLLGTSLIIPSDYGNRSIGHSVRCIADS